MPVLDVQLLYLALKEMRREYRRCLLLHYVENRSYADIAKTMRLPVNTVGSHIHRARKQLKQLMGARLDSDPAHTPA